MALAHHSLPQVIVPTKYYKTPTDHFRKLGISMVIWANHNMRASVSAMQAVSKVCPNPAGSRGFAHTTESHTLNHTPQQIHDDQSLINVEKKVASVSEVFRITRDDELREAEEKYLPKGE